MASQNGHCGIVRMLLEAKADVNIKTTVSHAACMVVFVYPADSMIECCVYCHLCMYDCMDRGVGRGGALGTPT